MVFTTERQYSYLTRSFNYTVKYTWPENFITITKFGDCRMNTY